MATTTQLGKQGELETRQTEGQSHPCGRRRQRQGMKRGQERTEKLLVTKLLLYLIKFFTCFIKILGCREGDCKYGGHLRCENSQATSDHPNTKCKAWEELRCHGMN